METLQLYKRRGRRISLTALIDVVFILLMFFMLTSTFTRFKAVDFQSPVSSGEQSAEKPQLVTLRADGSLQLENGTLIGSDEPLDASAFSSKQPVVLLPHADASLQLMVSSLERLKQLELAVTLGRAIPSATNH